MNSAARQGESALETPHAWRELTCQEYEDAIRADDEAHVASSITDPDGVYGSPLTFTLWLMSDGSYLSTALEGRRDTEDYKCSHAASVPVLETPPEREVLPTWAEKWDGARRCGVHGTRLVVTEGERGDVFNVCSSTAFDAEMCAFCSSISTVYIDGEPRTRYCHLPEHDSHQLCQWGYSKPVRGAPVETPPPALLIDTNTSGFPASGVVGTTNTAPVEPVPASPSDAIPEDVTVDAWREIEAHKALVECGWHGTWWADKTTTLLREAGVFDGSAPVPAPRLEWWQEQAVIEKALEEAMTYMPPTWSEASLGRYFVEKFRSALSAPPVEPQPTKGN